MDYKINNKENGPDPDFFVVGLQKSGTYWVTALLDHHPEIRCFPSMYGKQTNASEGRIFDMLASIDTDGGKAFTHSFTNFHDGFYKDLVPLLSKVSRDELLDRFRDRYRAWCNLHRNGKRLVGDKTTEYIFHLDMIDRFYPKAKKICIVRNPKDRVVSWHFHQIRRGRIPEGKISDDFVRDYVEERIKPEYESMLAYTGNLYCLTYENLSLSAEDTISHVLEYLGADTSVKVIKEMIKQASIEELRDRDKLDISGRGKKRGEQVASSHYRKGITGDWKNHLSERQVSYVDETLENLERKIFKKYL